MQGGYKSVYFRESADSFPDTNCCRDINQKQKKDKTGLRDDLIIS